MEIVKECSRYCCWRERVRKKEKKLCIETEFIVLEMTVKCGLLADKK